MAFRASRRLLSAISTASPTFPPPEALSKATATKPFHPKVWASMQPPTDAALHAFAARVRLFDSPSSSKPPPPDVAQLLTQALTHKSFLHLHREHVGESKPSPRTNQEWEALGNGLLGLFAAEYVQARYPHLPTRVSMAAVTAYVGPMTCSDVLREWGLTKSVRWAPVTLENQSREVSLEDASASVVRSLVGLVYQHRGFAAAREFVHQYFMSRQVDLRQFIKFRNPMKALRDTAAQFGRERPLSRLLSETGRYSISPVFVVGVYSGEDKLGEGFGSSKGMAEFRAAEDALRRLYLTQTPPSQLLLPTSTLPSELVMEGNPYRSLFGSPASEAPYQPVQLGSVEVQYGSAWRTPAPSS